MTNYLNLATMVAVAACLWFFWLEEPVQIAAIRKWKSWWAPLMAYILAFTTYILLAANIIAKATAP